MKKDNDKEKNKKDTGQKVSKKRTEKLKKFLKDMSTEKGKKK